MKKIFLFIFLFLLAQTPSVYSEVCTGDIFGDAGASSKCAQITEQQAKEKGYSASCTVDTQSAPNGQTLYSPVCSINGVDGFGANLLSGWTPSNGASSVNPGWNTLNTEVKRYESSTNSPILSSLFSTSSSALARTTRSIEKRIEQVRQQIFSVTRNMYKTQLEEFAEINPGIKSTVDNILSKTSSGSIGSLNFNPSQPSTASSNSNNSQSNRSCPVFSRNLKVGDSGNDVLALGEVLYEEGLYSGNDTNTFNSELEESVRDYQVKYKSEILDKAGLSSGTGIVGTLTREHLNNRCKNGSASVSDDPITNTPVSVDPNNISFRFMKVSTKENGWVSWREVEVYEKVEGGAERKINILPSKLTAGVFIFSGNPSEFSPSKAIDGNIETAWNAGETNIPCRTPGTAGCPGAVREADFILDLGKIKNISRIKLIENGDTITEVSVVYVSNNGKDYTELTRFTGPIADRQILSFPKLINPNAKAPVIAGSVVSKALPTADDPNIGTIRNNAVKELYNLALSLPASASGQATLRLKPSAYGYSPSGNFQYVWRVENADYIKIEKSIEIDPSLGVLSETESGGGCKIDKDARDASMFPTLDSSMSSLNMSPLVLFSYRFINPSVVYAPISEYANTCNIGKRYITTMTAYKSDSDKVAQFKFIIEVSK